MELIGLALVGAGLLVVAGVAKAIDPADTARAMSSFGPSLLARATILRAAVRLGAICEVAIGVSAIVRPGPVTVGLVAASYALFVVVIVIVRRKGGSLASCGCFGKPDTPATGLHVAVVSALAVSAAAFVGEVVNAGAGVSGTWLASFLANSPLHGVALVGLSLLGIAVIYVALTVAAQWQASVSMFGAVSRSRR